MKKFMFLVLLSLSMVISALTQGEMKLLKETSGMWRIEGMTNNFVIFNLIDSSPSMEISEAAGRMVLPLTIKQIVLDKNVIISQASTQGVFFDVVTKLEYTEDSLTGQKIKKSIIRWGAAGNEKTFNCSFAMDIDTVLKERQKQKEAAAKESEEQLLKQKEQEQQQKEAAAKESEEQLLKQKEQEQQVILETNTRMEGLLKKGVVVELWDALIPGIDGSELYKVGVLTAFSKIGDEYSLTVQWVEKPKSDSLSGLTGGLFKKKNKKGPEITVKTNDLRKVRILADDFDSYQG